METNNSQEQNEALGRLHPEYPAQYVLTNEYTGTVVWFENYNAAVRAHSIYGGTITNTETCPRHVIEATLRNARDKMETNGTKANQ